MKLLNPTSIRTLLRVLFLLSVTSQLAADQQLEFSRILYSGPIGNIFSGGRTAVYTDPVLAQLVDDSLAAPEEGDVAGESLRGGESKWSRISMNSDGVFNLERAFGGYIYLEHEAQEAQIALLRCDGNTEIMVNGVHRAGDYYGKGWIVHPVQLQPGRNQFWYKVGRGRNKRLTLEKPSKFVFLTPLDTTLPDLLTNEIGKKWAAIRVVNATDKRLEGLRITCTIAGKRAETQIAQTIPQMTSRKIPFQVDDGAFGPGKVAAEICLYHNDDVIDTCVIDFEVKDPSTHYKRTFFSDIDGSLQYYGVRQGTARATGSPAMFLSVHGAGVKGIGQAAAYENKDWGHVIAPTNRREFGFSWEDWGRLDALEALADAQELYGTDPDRTYLTGHSMGGHGAWHLGATFPDRWAAIAPMAGWRSFFTYVRRRSPDSVELTPIQQILSRSMNPSRTEEMLYNYGQHGVFIEHGDADRTVPVREARAMRESLAKFHPNMAYHEEPGGGHWYGVDHQRVFDFFADHQRTNVRDVPEFSFRVASPGVSSSCRYVTLFQQQESYKFCGVVAKQSVRSRGQRRNDEALKARKIEISTENLACFRIDLDHCKQLEELEILVDNQPIEKLPWPEQDHVWLRHGESGWSVSPTPTVDGEKHPGRYGGFKDAFNHQFVLVYATGGNAQENAWAYDKARFDAETFYYRGNSSMDMIPDSEFSLQAYPDRSVILYGNASTNKAWSSLLADSPIQINRESIRLGTREWQGEDYGLYMVRPRLDSKIASVGVVAGTGRPGMTAVIPNRYFIAGPGFPDFLVVTADVFRQGESAIAAAGYFDNAWSLAPGQFAISPSVE